MKTTESILLILCCCLIASCKHQDKNESLSYRINVSDSVSQRIYVSDFDSINPETSQNSMLYSIGEIIPYHEGYIIIGKEKALYFKPDGSFVCNIGNKGRGEGEYLSLSSCYVCQDTVNIFSSDNNLILKYTMDNDEFRYSGTVTIPDSLSLRKIIRSDLYPDRYFCQNIYHGVGGVVPSVCIYDTDFNRTATSQSMIKDGGMSYQYPFSSTKDGVFFTDFLSYTITELKTDTIDESLSFDFMENNFPKECIDYTNVLEAINLINSLDIWNKTLITRIVKSGDDLYVGLSSGRMARYNTLTGKSSTVRFMKNSSEPLMYPTFLIEDGTLLLASSPSDETLDNPPIYKIPLDIFDSASDSAQL